MMQEIRDRLNTDGVNTKFIWFSGKGGVGKTTISAATALQLADRGHDVLLVSTDPAHSVSDALDIDVDGTTQVRDNFWVMEVDPEQEVTEYRARLEMTHGAGKNGMMNDVYEGMDIMKTGPGVAEMAAFHKFIELMHSGEYDVIVFDTAPTGHTLNLLELPEVMDSMVGKVLQMRMRFSDAINTVKGMFGQDTDDDAGLEKLKQMKERIENARAMMQDPDRTSFNVVLLAEQMSIYESGRALDRLDDFDIPVGRLFVNQLIPENPDCDFCTSRREMQQENLTLIHDKFSDHDIIKIPLFDTEIRGMEKLETVADHFSRD